MAMRVNPDTGEVGVKQRYRVTNWSEYDRALVNRGNLTIWFDDESLRDSWTPPPPVGRGTPGRYSEIALQTCLTIKGLFQLPYRATEGLVRSLMRLCHLDLPVPDHSYMSRCQWRSKPADSWRRSVGEAPGEGWSVVETDWGFGAAGSPMMRQ
ncbi:transposase, partial [Accumulibacter sp.]|uniref:transposase n=1 Tax=Accumulibacter sp. TaxID=2053492 RepID=UPI00258AAB76